MKKILLVLLLVTGFLITTTAQDSGTLSVEIASIRSDNGKVFVSLHNGPEGFPGGDENMYKGAIVEIEGGVAVATFKDVPFGEYAVSVFHDENDNGELDTNWLGIPKEGLGASNNAKGRMGPPKYEDAKFEFKEEGQVARFDMDYF